MEKVISMSKDENFGEALRRIEAHLRNDATKRQLIKLLGVDEKFIDEYDHETLINDIISQAVLRKSLIKKDKVASWQDIIDELEIDDVRVCTECGNPMVVGVLADENYYCCDECLDKGLGIEKYLELAKDADTDEDCAYFYTEW